ncbi:hypothetical protein RJ641_014014 [Dillenia turbinata]|uniref:Uncharacterized protein n=1 Tax=Dillenia turbinata TaxID=194707 RepID=A0AAN8ZV97_9MAGN
MKQMEAEGIKVVEKSKEKCSATPPPPPLMPRHWVAVARPTMKKVNYSVTKLEIERFWRQRRMEEEDHLLAAIKAAARIRAENLTKEDYWRFEESLEEDAIKMSQTEININNKVYDSKNEIRVGVKDWWTKSKYAYLNQPAIETTEEPKRASKYIPNNCFYEVSAPDSAQAAYLGVF